MSKILIAVPRADETAFHAGGTLANLIAEGHEVYEVVVATGGTGSFTMEKDELEVQIRKEAHRSAEILGLQEIFLWGLGDGTLYEGHVAEIQARLTALTRRLQIDTIFGFDPWL